MEDIMNRFVKIGLLMVLVIALFGSYHFVKAQSESRATALVAPPVFSQQSPPVVGTKHVLETTIINTCGAVCPGGPLTAGVATPIDAVTTVTCPGTSGTCTIYADQDVQLTANGSTLGICFLVDGTTVNGCYFTAITPANGDVVQNHTSQGISGVPHGTHTVQTAQYSQTGGFYIYYSAIYRIYKP
jgi:hypothetical protein